MSTFATVALICGTVLLVAHGLAACLTTKWNADRAHRTASDAEWCAIEARRVAVAERDVAIKEQQAKIEAEKPAEQPMPSELVDRIMAWEDEFAQEAERKTILGLYAELRDWKAVMEKLPALSPVVITDRIAAPTEGLA